MAVVDTIVFFLLPFLFIGALFFVFWIIMLIDVATRKFKQDTEKIVWILVVIFTGIIGSFIYYFVVYINDNKKSIKWLWITLLVLVVLIILFFFFGLLASVSPVV